MSQTITLEVMRYRPGEDAKPWPQAFQIEWTQDMSILDALALIKDDFEPELAYRWSCRMEVCGSCGMVINGEPKLACSTFVRDYAAKGKITVGALDQFPIEKDLIVDADPFIQKLESVKPYKKRKKARPLSEKEHKQVMNDENGIWPCTFVGYCSEVCPKHVDPAGAIQQVKAAAVPFWAISQLQKEEESK